MPTQRDYYDVLGVPRNSSDEEIKRAYRNLARQSHPDVVRETDKTHAEANFKEINEAYSVLSDANKRAYYDRYGKPDPRVGPGGAGFAGEGIGDLFDFFFGGGMQRQTGPARGSDLRYDLQIELSDVLHGCEREISFTHLARCDTCAGKGSADGSEPTPCPDCRGTGELRHARNTPFGQFVASAPCARCGGRGAVLRNPCRACHGRGRRDQPRKLTVKIPPGADNGTRIRHNGLGEAGERGGPSGDLYVYVSVAEHDVFQREGADLHCETAVSFTQAALGATLEIDTLDGAATLRVPAGTQTGTTFRIPARGLPKMRGSGKGDLIVDVRVVVPSKLTRKQRQLLEEFAQAGGEDVEDKNIFKKVREAFGTE